MAKARETGTLPDAVSGYDDTDEALNALEQTLATLDDAQQARVLLYRQGANGTRDKFLKQMTPLEWRSFDLAGVLADYGGGSFRVRVYNEDTKLVRNVGFEIEEPRGGAKPRLAEVAPVPAQNNAEILAGIAQLATTMQATMLTGFKELATALAPKQESRQDFLNELTVMKTLFAPQTNGAKSELGNLDALMRMFEFVNEKIPRTGESSGADVFRDLIKEFAPVLAQAAQRMSVAQPVAPVLPAPARPVTPAPVGAAPPTPTQPAPEPAAPQFTEEEQEMSLRLKLAVGMMLKKAELGEPAEDFADSVLDWIPEDMYDSLATTATPELIGHLAAIDARVTLHSEWFAALHAAIKERLTEEPPTGTNTEPGASESTS